VLHAPACLARADGHQGMATGESLAKRFDKLPGIRMYVCI
jgi:hypothetical protein